MATSSLRLRQLPVSAHPTQALIGPTMTPFSEVVFPEMTHSYHQWVAISLLVCNGLPIHCRWAAGAQV
eukprot:scaffold252615_cov18-Tisochrysis_lutea.AAC.1